MGPYFEAQNSRLDSMDVTIKHLKQRNEILEDGIANIRSTLLESACGLPVARVRSSGRTRSGSPSSLDEGQSNSAVDTSSNLSSSTATTYLLSLHESLREEVSQLSHAITDLDARASMAIMNENLRIKEDMAHTNAALNSVRMQVHWLMNPRLHQGQRSSSVAPTSNQSRAVGLGSSSSGSSSAAGSSPLLRSRRLSDGGREGTKL